LSPFSERLRALRLRYGVRQKDLAEAMGFEQSYVSALELGIKGPPSRDFVDRLARYLRLSADELAGLLSDAQIRVMRELIETWRRGPVTRIRPA
jgi:transcriptional regulator with XRE-family HTH domain